MMPPCVWRRTSTPSCRWSSCSVLCASPLLCFRFGWRLSRFIFGEIRSSCAGHEHHHMSAPMYTLYLYIYDVDRRSVRSFGAPIRPIIVIALVAVLCLARATLYSIYINPSSFGFASDGAYNRIRPESEHSSSRTNCVRVPVGFGSCVNNVVAVRKCECFSIHD